MIRRLIFTSASALSLVLCVSVAAIWVRSYFVADELTWEYGNHDRIGPNGVFREVSVLSRPGAIGLHERYYEIQKRFIGLGGRWNDPEGLSFTWEQSSPDMPLGYISRPFLWKPAEVVDHRIAGLQVGFGARAKFVEIRGSGFRGAPGFDRHRWARIPLGYVALVLSILPATWVCIALRHHVKKGRCTSCGYRGAPFTDFVFLVRDGSVADAMAMPKR